MDEYKEYIYDRNRKLYDKVNVGDLTKQRAIRNKLKCKPFKWYIENVAYELIDLYPVKEPPLKAYGAIRSISDTGICIDSLFNEVNEQVHVNDCDGDFNKPSQSQNWTYTWYRDIRERHRQLCLRVDQYSEITQNIPVVLRNCHGQQRDQAWRYDVENNWITHEIHNMCLDYDSKTLEVFVNKCSKDNVRMKWEWGFFNKTGILKG